MVEWISDRRDATSLVGLSLGPVERVVESSQRAIDLPVGRVQLAVGGARRMKCVRWNGLLGSFVPACYLPGTILLP